MIKKIFGILILGLLVVNTLFAQNFGNEWINYNQKYYAFKVNEDGIVRISYSALANAGVPLNSINNPKNFQIFGRGQKQYIYVHNENTGVFSPNDYIEFYAQKNDGWYDSVLYKQPDFQTNKEYSLFTDTATYYFTWNNSLNNHRLTIETDVNYSSYTPATGFWKLSKLYYNTTYMDGVLLKYGWSSFISDPEYAEGEGWYDSPIFLGGSRIRNVATPNVYSAGPNAQISFDVLGASDYSNLVIDHHLRVEFAGQTIDSLYGGYRLLHFNYQVAASALGSSNTSFKFSSINDLGSGADRFAVSFVHVKYPHTLSLEGKNSFRLFVPDASGQSKTYLNLSSFAGGSSPVFYDLTNNKKITITSGSNYQVLIPNSGGEKECFIAGAAAIKSITDIKPVGANAQFVNYVVQNPNVDYVIISHNRLMGNASQSTANDYAAYRNSVGYNVLLVDAEKLYDQYSYGIRKNPLAIRNFVRALGNQYGFNQFKALFLIGKSYRANDYRRNPTLFDETLVPTLGTPPSDILLTSGLVDNLYTPAIPTGRLSAKTIDHVDLYLDKIMTYEDRVQNPTDIWMKNVMHFSGGSSKTEQDRIAKYLGGYEKIVKDTLFGANVITIRKTTTDPIQINLSEIIKSYINNGVSLMTFFGHAAGIGFDISIDNPSEYNNDGKYPFLLANSCYAGDIFQLTNSGTVNSSEEFVLIRRKGMIGYLASVTPSSEIPLDLYSTSLYKNFSYKHYGKSMGFIIQQTIKEVQSSLAARKEICLEMTLHGDPALSLNSADLPDYYINHKSVFYNPFDVTTAVDSFDFHLVIANQGRAVGDSLLVEIVRNYPGMDSVDRYKYLIPSPKFRDTISIRMPVNSFFGVGNNSFSIALDSYNSIPELNENNNTLNTVLNIKAADLSPVYPPEFAVVGTQNIVLKASTYYPFSPNSDYVFELDTSYYFDSPIKLKYKTQAKGGVIEWTPMIVLQDSVVYYWRVSLDSNSKHDYNWRQSSFQYILGKSGWSQAHFFQFKNNKYQFTKFNELNRKFLFVNDIKNLIAQTGIYPNIGWTEIFIKLNNTPLGAWSCIPPNVGGMKYFVFDEVSGELWWSKGFGWGYGVYDNLHCTGYDYPCFEYPTSTTNLGAQGLGIVQDTTWYQRAANFLAQVPDGNKVMAMSFGNAHPADWPEYLYKAFDSIGSVYIRSIQNDIPFIIYGTKGIMNSAKQVIGATNTDIVILKDSIVSNWNEGQIKSPIIGPSKKWTSLHWKQHSLDSYPSDSVRLELLGIKIDGSSDVIISGLPPDSADVLNLHNRIDADLYPYCQLIVYMKDDSTRTPAQIDYWRIIYEGVTELALAPKEALSFYKDTIMQGDTVVMTLAYRNISDVNADSLLVSYWISDVKLNVLPLGERRLAPIAKNSFIIDTIFVDTKALLGQCYLHVDINAFNEKKGAYDQLEQTHLNNTGDYPFFVVGDQTNPLLDVTFDGVHILDGDIVSAKPEVLISLRDDSKLRAIEDTASFKIYIKGAKDVDFRYIPFKNSDILEFIPADLPDNTGQVIYRPTFADDGEYELMVQARDASYNQSGESDLDNFYIKFKIINKATITEVMNWPNPFSDKTHFVFTLTGSQLPDYFKIQIMTVTGKVVREIDMNELGPLHIGRNITEYAWDGRDDFGDQLANGVYLYRVVTRLNGENIELNQTQASQYFTKSFGKMYLMR